MRIKSHARSGQYCGWAYSTKRSKINPSSPFWAARRSSSALASLGEGAGLADEGAGRRRGSRAAACAACAAGAASGDAEEAVRQGGEQGAAMNVFLQCSCSFAFHN